ncbi:hypothetical protein G6F66_005237 [Rhizopus arrhizus]|nr:hypothetical protein G6F23_002012 [Rhizopus arrhizus]KAG1294412.1 hypothetical protein G6F66_005237 [Rhizopus arrhizus]
MHHSKSQSNMTCHNNVLPSLPSLSSSSSTASSTASSTVPILPKSNSSIKQHKKRLHSSEFVLRFMDQCLLQKQHQQRQLDASFANPNSSTSVSMNMVLRPQQQQLFDSALLNPNARRGSTRQAREHAIKKSPKNALPKLSSSQQQIALITEWPYVLTQDNEEQDRMVAQHYLLRTAFGSDFCSPIRSQLQKGIIVLDVGCGPGTWTMEMGTAFPKSTFIGIDQSAFFPKDIKPKNCHFRTCGHLVQHQLPLPFPDNSIDYIYQRDMNWGLTGQTWQALLKEYLRILKPGGWIEVVEQDFETQNSPENECYMNDKLIANLCLRMQDPYAVHRLPTMLLFNGFNSIETISKSCPLGWGTDTVTDCSSESGSATVAESSSTVEQQGEALKCSEFSRAMASQYTSLLKSLRPWLSTVMNLDYEKYDDYIAGLPAEWRRAKTCINWHCFISQKPHYT